MYRVGLGYDIHKLATGRKLIIGGVEIPYEKGLLGHSDADVLIHAIIDGMLGALALDDIGTHFPDTDEKYKNADSKELLKITYDLIKSKGYELNNLDSNILAQAPKMRGHILKMREVLAGILETDTEKISIKAKTNEEQDSVGLGNSIKANAIVTLKKIGV
ncbi:2-C-methyl-D-erythritol 2,4-cyclodiphosphate synthase [bacterium]|nr:2-C-methyl-D-erythritol 2,4-cyclodiphosphate synthase [bacterium]